jgi:hypothetical protein
MIDLVLPTAADAFMTPRSVLGLRWLIVGEDPRKVGQIEDQKALGAKRAG